LKPGEKSDLGVRIIQEDVDRAEIIRRTRETEVFCRIEAGPRREWRISTGIDFLDHMIEILAFYSGLNIDLEVKSGRRLQHTVAEDAGIALGRALRAMALRRIEAQGIMGFGFSQGMLDEAYSEARISFEGRAGCYIHRCSEAGYFGIVEGIEESFLEAFFQGFSQGMGATIQIELRRGKDSHHLWESAFRAFGNALRMLLSVDEWKRGSIAGVKEIPE